MDELVAAKDRISVDITDIKDRVEGYRDDPAWRELSMAGKIRALVIEKLEEKESKQAK
jgi:hypothetical protein